MASSQRLRFDEAVQLIADKDKRNSDDVRTVKDRTRKRIKRAIKAGHLIQQVDKTILHEDLMAWAAGKFKNFPAPDRLCATFQAYTAKFVGIDVPATCEEAMRLCADLQIELIEARNEIFELRPDAEKWRGWLAKKKKSR